MTAPMITVENVIHLDVTSNDCCCPKEACGGVETAHIDCLEHGAGAGPLMSIHSHKRGNPVY